MVYKIAKRLIESGRTNNIIDKLNVWLATDQLTAEQYSELCGMLEQGE